MIKMGTHRFPTKAVAGNKNKNSTKDIFLSIKNYCGSRPSSPPPMKGSSLPRGRTSGSLPVASLNAHAKRADASAAGHRLGSWAHHER